MKKINVIQHILSRTNHGHFVNNSGGSAWASSNVALCKYWGKRDSELNLPVTSSLSISLGHKGTYTRIKQEGEVDYYVVNGKLINQETKFATRLKKFLDLFCPQNTRYSLEINTNVPIAAGFASSACGFASIVLALNNLYAWRLSKKDLSIMARLGSGSACRSVMDGFVEWQKGERSDGMDSYGEQLEYTWPELRIGMLMISMQEKSLSSRDAMECTVKTSSLYSQWPAQVKKDLTNLKQALAHHDFMLFGKVAENNAIAMHAMMSQAKPSINYSLPETLQAVIKIQELRSSGEPLFFTQDAGSNLQLLFLAQDTQKILNDFPKLEIVSPFVAPDAREVILVNENDIEIGISGKMDAHISGQLHRAFSIAILRRRNDTIEMLLQKRSLCKYHSANLWSNTCCSHPPPGEDFITSAENRLQEEMGFRTSLKEVDKFHYLAKFPDVNLIENEIDHILVGFSDIEKPPFNPYEAQDFCWLELNFLKQDLQKCPSKYTVWLPQVVDLLLKNMVIY